MKFNRLLALLTIIFTFFLQQAIVVQAEEPSFLKVDVTTDKQEYAEKDEITYLLTISNTSDFKAKDVVVTSTIPDSLEVTSSDSKVDGNKVIWNVESIDGMGQAKLEFSAKVTGEAPPATVPVETDVEGDAGSGSGTGNTVGGENKDSSKVAPKTGDDTNFFGYFVLLVLSVIVLVVGIRALMKKKVTKELTFILILSLLLPSFSAIANAEERKEIVEDTHTLVINEKEYVVKTTVEAALDAGDENPSAVEVPVTGVVFVNENERLVNGTITFSAGENDAQVIETDAEGYFVARLQKGETYTVEGEGISSSITVTDVNQIAITNTLGKISLGKTLANGDNIAVLQPSTIHLDKEVAELVVEVAEDSSKVVFEGEMPLNPGDIILLPELEDYPTGLALKVIEVSNVNNQTVVKTSEPKLGEVFAALKGDTSVSLTSEYFEPAPGVTIEDGSSAPAIQPRTLSGDSSAAAIQPRTFSMMRSIEEPSESQASIQSTVASPRAATMTTMQATRAIDDALKLNISNLFGRNSPVKFDGTLELQGDFTGEIDWAFELDLVDSWDFRYTGSQIFKGELYGQVDTSERIPPINIGNFRIPTQIPGFMVHLPVDIVVGMEGKVAVEVSAGMKQDIGIEYSDRNGLRTYPEDKVQPVFNVSDLTGAGSASLGLKLSVLAEEAGIDIAGVSGEGGLSGEAKTSIVGPTGFFNCASLSSKFYAKFLLEAPIIDWQSDESLSYEINLGSKDFGNCVRSISASPSSIEMAPGDIKSFTVTANDGLGGYQDIETESETSYRTSDSSIIKVEKENNKVNVIAADNAQDGDRETIHVTYKVQGKEFKDTISVRIVDNRERGTLVGQVVDAVDTTPLKEASVKIYDGNRLVTDIDTEEDGTYEATLVPGIYKIVVSYPNYVTDTSNVTINAANTTTYDSKLQMVGDEYSGVGTVEGTISNALTGQPVSGLNLVIRKGRNNTSGEVVETIETDDQGNYSIDLPGGNYTIEISGTGYITTSMNIIALGGLTKGSQNGTISPEGLLGEGVRVVLNWGATPRDLDSHLTGPAVDGSRFHVYYSNQVYKDANNDANLDVDDTTSYGPETVTVIKRVNEGTYTYGIHDYTNRGENNLNLSNSDATVRVYSGNVLLATYYVPINKSGNLWRVFEIRDGEIVPINKIDYITDWHSADSYLPQGQ